MTPEMTPVRLIVMLAAFSSTPRKPIARSRSASAEAQYAPALCTTTAHLFFGIGSKLSAMLAGASVVTVSLILFGLRIATPHGCASARNGGKAPPTRAVGKTPAETHACGVCLLFGEFFIFAVSVAAREGLASTR